MISLDGGDLALFFLFLVGPVIVFAVIALVLLRFAFRRGQGWGLLALAVLAGFLAGPPLYGYVQAARLERELLRLSYAPDAMDWSGKTVLMIRPEGAHCYDHCIPIVAFSGARAVYSVSAKDIYPRAAQTPLFDLNGLVAQQVLVTERSKKYGFMDPALQLPGVLPGPVDIVVLQSYSRLTDDYPLLAPPVPEGWKDRGHFTSLQFYELETAGVFDPLARPTAQFVTGSVRSYPFWTWIYGTERRTVPQGRVFRSMTGKLICDEKARDKKVGFYCFINP